MPIRRILLAGYLSIGLPSNLSSKHMHASVCMRQMFHICAGGTFLIGKGCYISCVASRHVSTRFPKEFRALGFFHGISHMPLVPPFSCIYLTMEGFPH